MYYFDYNGTTPLHPEAKNAWLGAYENAWMNPSSLSREGARVHVLLDQARERLGGILGTLGDNIVFTSGATESNNGLMRYMAEKLGPNAQVAISSVEHPSVKEAAQRYFQGRVLYIPVDNQGIVDMAVLQELLKTGAVQFVSVMALNNETGVIYPWESIQKLCKEYGAWYHVDASQWLGKLPAKDLGQCDFVTGCAHKFGGPKGVGFLKFHPEFNDIRLQYGGAQDNGHRAGTEDYPSIIAMVRVLEIRETGTQEYQNVREPWRLAFERELLAYIPGIRIVGQKASRVWNTSNLVFPKHRSCDWVALLERSGCVVSMRSACSTEKGITQGALLEAMGFEADDSLRAIRVSGGWATTKEEWLFLAKTMIEGWRFLEEEALHSQVISV